MCNAEFQFTLSTDEHRRLKKLVYATDLPPWYYPLIATTFGLQVVARVIDHHWSFWAVVALIAAVAGVALCVGLLKHRLRRLAVDSDVILSESGLSGALDGAPATIRWSDIANVRDLGDAIVIMRKRAAGAIAIPTASIANRDEFWAVLEDKLVSKRGLVRSQAPRRQILNTAC